MAILKSPLALNRLYEMLKARDIEETDIQLAIANDIIAIRDLPENFLSAPPPEKAERLKALLDHLEISEDEIRVYWQEPYSYLMREDLLDLAAVPSGVAAAGTPDGTAPALGAASQSKDGSQRDTGSGESARKRAEAEGPGGEAAARKQKRFAGTSGESEQNNGKPGAKNAKSGDEEGRKRARKGVSEQEMGSTGGEHSLEQIVDQVKNEFRMWMLTSVDKVS